MPFRDRTDAGRRLAQVLAERRLLSPIVLGLPRGGVPVAVEVAKVLDAPVEVFVARKVAPPGHEELGIGAVAESLEETVISDTARQVGIDRQDLAVLAARVREEVQRRVASYRDGRPLPDLAGHDVVLVDDGLATGVTAEAALRALRLWHPHRLVLAVPACPEGTTSRLAGLADEVVCVESSSKFFAVGQWYDDFSQTTDQEVVELLERARTGRSRPG